MSEENKAVNWKFEGTKLLIDVDTNKDGDAVISIKIDLAEIADEVMDALKKD